MPRKFPLADDDENEEEEDATSEFTAAEMWHRLPSGLQDEIFGSLNLQQANRLCRVSKDWSFSLERIALLNKGLIVFDCPVPGSERGYCESHPAKRFRRDLPWIWDTLSFIRNRTVRTFVVLEDHPSCLNMEFADRGNTLCAKLNVLRCAHPQLRTVIFSGGHRLSFGNIAVRSETLFGGKFKNVRFINFEVEHYVATASVFFNPPDSSKTFPIAISWRPRVALKVRHVTKKVMGSIEADVDANDPPTRAPGKPRIWKYYGRLLLIGDDYDPTTLFWPYPEEQLDWLKSCLSNLDSRSNRTIKKAVMASYMEYYRYNSGSSQNPKEQWTGNKGPLKKMGVFWPPKVKQELDVMDCAFLARVFSLTPGMPKPPCGLPNDFEKRVRNN